MGVTDEAARTRIRRRIDLREELDRFARTVDNRGNMRAFDEFEATAWNMLTSSAARRAFDLSKEDDAVRDRYGRNTWGQQCLLARRLVESGVDLVTTTLAGPICGRVQNWDDHAVNHHVFDAMQARAPYFDQAVAALITDLYERGLDKRVMLIVTGEFGRTPKISYAADSASGARQPGRDHWPRATTMMFSGGGIDTGKVIGATDRRGEDPIERRVGPPEFLATVYRHLGVNTRGLEFQDFSGRPIPVRDLRLRSRSLVNNSGLRHTECAYDYKRRAKALHTPAAKTEKQSAHQWTQLKGNSGFTGLSPDDSVKPPLKLVWSFRLDGDASGDAGAGVIVAGGKVIVPVANSHSIVALDADNGRFLLGASRSDRRMGRVHWVHDRPVLRQRPSDSLATAKRVGSDGAGCRDRRGRVFVSTRANQRRGPKPDNFRGRITALDAKTGKKLWHRNNVYSWTPMASDGKVLACPIRGGCLVSGSTVGPKSVLCRAARSGQRDLAANRRDVLWIRRNGIRRRPAVPVGQPRPVRNRRRHVCRAQRQHVGASRKDGSDTCRCRDAYARTVARQSRFRLSGNGVLRADVNRDGPNAGEPGAGLDGNSAGPRRQALLLDHGR